MKSRTKNFPPCPTILLMIGCVLTSSQVSEGNDFPLDKSGFLTTVQPFLRQHCIECHGAENQEGGFRIDQLGLDLSQRHVAASWHELLDRVNKGEMPPAGQPRPDSEVQASVSEWIAKQLRLAIQLSQSTGGQIVIRRLNRSEYRYTIRDLLGPLDGYDPAGGLPADPPAFGFDNIGNALTTSPLHFEKYLAAARQVIDRAIVVGPQPVSRRWHMEVEAAHPSNQFEGRDSAGKSELWTKDPHALRHRYLVKGGGTNVVDGWLVKKGARGEATAGFRWFRIPQSGSYRIRIRAAAHIPSRQEVEQAIQEIRWGQVEQDLVEKQASASEISVVKKRWIRDEWPEILGEAKEKFYYNYGAPRMKIVDGKGVVVDEFCVEASLSEPQTYELKHEFQKSEGKDLATITIENSYVVPGEVGNHWYINRPEFPRPELWVDWLEIEGPHFDTWPPASQERLLSIATAPTNEIGRAQAILKRFMFRAFRRPVEEDELEQMVDLFREIRPTKPSFNESIKLPLIATLCSPNFLYLVEPNADTQRRNLNDYEIAVRLSYFLWSSMPDEELFAHASQGQLSNTVVLRQQVQRMLKDSKSRRFVRNFSGQWLGLRKIGDNPPSRDLFPRYDDHLQESMARESEAFFAEVLDHDLDILNFLDSDFVTINNRLARFYKIPGVLGDSMRRVSLGTRHDRGGLLTQASILTTTSNGTRTSPVIRGKWILENLLGDPPPPPPPDAGDIQPKVPGIDKATVRKRLEHHRALPACASCHAKIDPLGFALENFAADGSWREQEGFGYKGRVGRSDPSIDASGHWPDGKTFDSFDEFRRQLVHDKQDAFLDCLVRKLSTYALGRGLEFSDEPEIERLVANLQSNGRTLRKLIEDIVTSRNFRTK